MKEETIDVETADGAMNTFVVYPDEGRPHPVILFLMDAPGFREELRDMARRLATSGFFVLLPNLYYRVASEFQFDETSESADRMFAYMESLTNAMVVDDSRALLTYADGHAGAAAGPAGALGYCMSGAFVFAAAGQIPDRIAAAASIHGVRLCTKASDSPHLTAAQVRGELYFACAAVDEFAPDSMIEDLKSYLADTAVEHRIETYPNTEHGFVFPTRQGKYHKQSAERHWYRIVDLFRRRCHNSAVAAESVA